MPEVLQWKTGAKVGVVTTKGFRDLLEIGRQTRPRMYDLQADHPPPLARRQQRGFGVDVVTVGE